MSQSTNSAVIAWTGFRRLFTDRLGMFFLTIFPFLIIFLVGTSFFDEEQTLTIGIVSNDAGRFAQELIDGLEAAELITIESYADSAAMQREILRESIVAGVVIPKTYTEALEAGETQEVGFVFNPRRNDVAQTVRTILDRIVVEQGAEIRAALFAAEVAGGSFDENLAIARELQSSSEAGITVTQQVVGAEETQSDIPLGFTYPVAATLVLFVFINTLGGAQIVIANRTSGISTRIMGTPTRAGSLVLGEAGARFGVALLQSVVIVVFGTLAFGIDFGDPLAATILVLVFSLVATGGAMLLGTVTKSQQLAAALAPSLGIGMGMLGGGMWPLEIVSDTMKVVGHITPHAWAMDAFVELFGRGGSLSDIVPELAVLLGFAVVLLAVSSIRMRKGLEA
jgi:ABC-2 type transport system permease protein